MSEPVSIQVPWNKGTDTDLMAAMDYLVRHFIASHRPWVEAPSLAEEDAAKAVAWLHSKYQ